jgi:hypothetical protein
MANKKIFFLQNSKLFTLQNLCMSMQTKTALAAFSAAGKRALLLYFNDRVETTERIHFR